jgi:predicted lipoprotein with Yx(FWY)xxD motif
MTRSRLTASLAGAAVLGLTALSVAACGGGSSSGASASTTPPTPTKNTSARSATVHVAKTRLGRILVDSQGRTLYLFRKDSGKKSSCVGTCATFWPPLQVGGKPAAGSGAHASMVATITRSGGKRQVTYNGHPLYRFAKDKKPGDTKGEGLTAFGARWFAVSPAGKQVSPRHGAAPSAPKPSPPAAPKPSPPPHSNPIPQNGGGDGDSDNFGGPSDGDGDI